MSERYLSVREFAGLLSVARITVIKWIKSGKIVAYNINGRWRIPYSEVERILKGIQRIRKVAIYARINNNTQRDDLEKQIESLKLWASKNLPQAEYIVVTDVASGLKEDRRGLRKLTELARQRQIDAIAVAYRDRLTRFGFEYLKELFKSYGADVIVALNEEPKNYMQELIEDLIKIVTSFADRIYGKRSRKYEKVVRAIEQTIKDP